jgi:hypothetical protein
MNLEIRILNKLAEVHVIDSVSSRPISIINVNMDSINQLISKLMLEYRIFKIYRSKKKLLTNHRI